MRYAGIIAVLMIIGLTTVLVADAQTPTPTPEPTPDPAIGQAIANIIFNAGPFNPPTEDSTKPPAELACNHFQMAVNDARYGTIAYYRGTDNRKIHAIGKQRIADRLHYILRNIHGKDHALERAIKSLAKLYMPNSLLRYYVLMGEPSLHTAFVKARQVPRLCSVRGHDIASDEPEVIVDYLCGGHWLASQEETPQVNTMFRGTVERPMNCYDKTEDELLKHENAPNIHHWHSNY